ncbi:hypothetical protein [Mumia sp. DW29H23]|uniref:hypothetical protein n=1 Tax=Mumia sp. DW29H23 TaxID=3421241 RepID=UPI003D6900C0
MKRTTTIAGLTLTALTLTVGTAQAFTIDTDGKGFVGKGEVQSAYNLNNAAMQKAVDAKAFTFKAEQPTVQELTQDVRQTGTQAGTQDGTMALTQLASQSATQTVTQDLTCTFTNGSGTKTFHREGVRGGERTGAREGVRVGVREGVRAGERDGVRTGVQSGKQVGSLASDLNVTDKKTGQYTGFNLKGFTGTTSYSTVGPQVWEAPELGAWEFGDYHFGAYEFGAASFAGDYAFSDAYTWEPVSVVEWGTWENVVPGENPDDCLRSTNADKITQISDVITPGAITDGAITDGDVTDGPVTDGAISDGEVTPGAITAIDPVGYGAITDDGTPKVLVTYNGVTKVLTAATL